MVNRVFISFSTVGQKGTLMGKRKPIHINGEKFNTDEIKNCPCCGCGFVRPQNYSDKQWRDRVYCSRKCSSTKILYTHNDIVFMYLVEKMSSTEIGLKCGISGTHVLRILNNENVKIRSDSDNKKLALNHPATREKMSKSATGRRLSESCKAKLRAIVGPKNRNWRNGITMSSEGYLQFTASEANGVHAGKLLHNIIAEWKYGRVVKPGEHVHHIDKNKINNAPDNLVIITASHHAKIHTEDRENGKFESM